MITWRVATLLRLYKEVQQQVLALEEDLEKAAHEREKIDIEYNKRLSEEKLKCEETVSRFYVYFVNAR